MLLRSSAFSVTEWRSSQRRRADSRHHEIFFHTALLWNSLPQSIQATKPPQQFRIALEQLWHKYKHNPTTDIPLSFWIINSTRRSPRSERFSSVGKSFIYILNKIKNRRDEPSKTKDIQHQCLLGVQHRQHARAPMWVVTFCSRPDVGSRVNDALSVSQILAHNFENVMVTYASIFTGPQAQIPSSPYQQGLGLVRGYLAYCQGLGKPYSQHGCKSPVCQKWHPPLG